MPVIGDRSRLAFVIGQRDGFNREVDIHAAGRWVTCDDSMAYARQFAGAVSCAIDLIMSDRSPARRGRPYPELSPGDNHLRLLAQSDNTLSLSYAFMQWGPTTDNITAHVFVEGNMVFIPFSFWRPEHHDRDELGRVFVVEIPERELVWVLHRAAWLIAFDS